MLIKWIKGNTSSETDQNSNIQIVDYDMSTINYLVKPQNVGTKDPETTENSDIFASNENKN